MQEDNAAQLIIDAHDRFEAIFESYEHTNSAAGRTCPHTRVRCARSSARTPGASRRRSPELTAERAELVQGMVQSFLMVEEINILVQMIENVFLPRVAELNRNDLIEEIKKDTSALTALMVKIDEVGLDSEHFEPTYRLVQEAVRVHVEAEEALLLPLAKQAAELNMIEIGQEMLRRTSSTVDDERPQLQHGH